MAAEAMCDEITENDQRQRRCPMLGHDIPFSYCRAPGSDLPCRRVFDCWWETFEAFIRRHYSEADVEKILSAPKDKRLSLVELIEKARKVREAQEAERD